MDVAAEEREKGRHNQLKSLQTAVYGIGIAIIGSGLTTIVGFGVLSFSTLPLMQHLGQTLALGIFYSLLAALLANPVFILLEEDFMQWRNNRLKKRFCGKNAEKDNR